MEERIVTSREGQQAAKINKDFFKEISVKEMPRKEFSSILIDLHDKVAEFERRSPRGSPKLKRRKSVEFLINQIDVLISDELTKEMENRKHFQLVKEAKKLLPSVHKRSQHIHS